jgi:hypothetical protein
MEFKKHQSEGSGVSSAVVPKQTVSLLVNCGAEIWAYIMPRPFSIDMVSLVCPGSLIACAAATPRQALGGLHGTSAYCYTGWKP